METVSHGLQTIAGWAREPLVSVPTWPAAAAVPVTRMIPVLSVDPQEGVTIIYPDTTEQGYGPGDVADILTAFPTEIWSCPLRFAGFEQVWACALGYMPKRLSSTLLPYVVMAGVYQHIIEVDHRLDSTIPWTTNDGFTGPELATPLYRVRRGTAAVWREVSVWELRGSMIRKLTLNASLQNGMVLTLDLAGYQRSRTSLINTAAILQALPVNETPNILFRQGVLSIAPYAQSGVFDASHEVGTLGWQLDLDNHLDADAGPSTGRAPLEYERTAAPTITLGLTMGRYTSDQRFTELLSGAPLMGQLKMTGGLIGSTGQSFACNLYLPRFTLSAVQSPASGPGVPSLAYQATLQVPRTMPAFVPPTHHAGPLVVELINHISQHPLLD